MDLDELRSVRRTERQKDSLQHLRDSFYEDVAAYIETRKAERRRTAAEVADPYGNPEVRQISDEISTAEDVVEAIYERRVGKVVKLASFAAADMSADKSGLTAEERALFDDLVDRIKRNRRTILDTLAGEGGDGGDVDIDVDGAPVPNESGAGSPTDGPPTSDGVDAADPDRSPAAADPADSADGRGPPGTESADEPPAPDDVLAAAMGGDDAASASDGETEAETQSRSDTDQEPAPPEVVGDPATDSERDVPVVDGAETDGGNAPVTAENVAGPAPTAGGPSQHDAGDDAGGRGAEHATEETADSRDDRVTLRITSDVGRIYGVDEREYDLASEDIVRLPATNAGPLVDRGAAERLE